MFERKYLRVLIERMNEPRKFIHVLLGPRQVGKTTIVEQMVNKLNVPYLFVNADNAVSERNTAWVDQQWETARTQLKAKGAQEFILIIDEIQRIHDWTVDVKKNWDYDTLHKINIKVVLLGSAQLALATSISESTAERFEVLNINHWGLDEMHTAFGVTPQQYAWFGGYPGAVHLMKDEKRWKNYINNSLIDTTLMKAVLMQTRIDKPALLRQVFDLACMYSGQILSYNKMLGQLQDAGNSSTIALYMQLLNTAGFVSGLPKYYSEQLQRKNSIPKLQVHNTALMAAKSQKRFNDVLMNPVEWGRVVESVVGAHLVNGAIGGSYKLMYWRERNDEVDFVMEQDGKIIGLEVKSGFSKNTQGMDAFRKNYNPHKVLMVGMSGIPWEDFLKINPNDLF